jgi:hypothetical protein
MIVAYQEHVKVQQSVATTAFFAQTIVAARLLPVRIRQITKTVATTTTSAQRVNIAKTEFVRGKTSIAMTETRVQPIHVNRKLDVCIRTTTLMNATITTHAPQCEGVKCNGYGSLVCDDGNPCTDDICDVAKGCLFPNNSNGCCDGDECTINDRCEGGKCKGET